MNLFFVALLLAATLAAGAFFDAAALLRGAISIAAGVLLRAITRS